ncbi:putative ATP-dependent RNA helicase DDX27 [Apostichopus japonicus]|uniref:RNA helicase n=1 Tax=Stichopus japonicus TaxID=307972 RepID=A0A2G8KK60_STIJA|nr:putative ATP-dependent RNA helicase DDX27 [Apostichopus japonicus]
MDFVRTIGEEIDIEEESEDSSSDEEAVAPKAFPTNKKTGKSTFEEEFEFTEKGLEEESEWTDGLEKFVKRPTKTTLEDKIAEIRRERKRKEALEKKASLKEQTAENKDEDGPTTDAEAKKETDENGAQEEEADSDDEDSSDEDEEVGVAEMNEYWDQVKNKSVSEKRVKMQQKEEQKEKKPFFQELPEATDEAATFDQMNLSRPLMKAISAMNFRTPTPIQSRTVPIALLGKDVCACAATGTGKTAAFMLPVLERLLYKPRQAPISRVLVLVPTRELGVQVFQVTKQLGQFTEVDVCLAVGGLEVKLQEASLRKGPDIIIATPGRLIDHLHNTPSFGLTGIEILILDEADRMLDEYFDEQMKEIVKMTSATRQTMLFSATMTDKVKDLALVSLKDPVRIFVNENTEVAFKLRQEFIRIRNNREGDREAIVAALCCRTFHDHCLVFVQTKKEAHRLHVILGLLGLNVGELHGNLKQPKRLESLRKFKEAQVDILVATDLAARGLDIEGVKTVINLTMPNTAQHYVHRVGRTARAGKGGRSVSLIGESERRMLKDIIKQSKTAVKSRTVPHEVVERYRDKIDSLEEDIKTVFRLEWEEKQIQTTEKQVHKAEKILEHQAEILSRPKRNWFQTHKERMQMEAAKRLEEGEKRKGKRDMDVDESADDRMEQELQKAQLFAAREAKRGRNTVKRPGIAKKQDKNQLWIQKVNKVLKAKEKAKKQRDKKSSFSRELTSISGPSVRQLRNRANEAEMEERADEKRQSYQNKGRKRKR